MDNPIKIAVVGVGYLGKIHAKIYAAMEDVNLVAVVDANPDVAEEVANAHGCEALTDIGDLAQRVDAVSIVVPTSLHFKVSKTFLEQGVHTMLEKPVARVWWAANDNRFNATFRAYIDEEVIRPNVDAI